MECCSETPAGMFESDRSQHPLPRLIVEQLRLLHVGPELLDVLVPRDLGHLPDVGATHGRGREDP